MITLASVLIPTVAGLGYFIAKEIQEFSCACTVRFDKTGIYNRVRISIMEILLIVLII